jgi:hypothetical protein
MVRAFEKIGPDATGQCCGFPDIEDMTGGILEEVYTRLVGQMSELRLEIG